MMKLYQLLNQARIACEYACIWIFRKDGAPGEFEVYQAGGDIIVAYHPTALPGQTIVDLNWELGERTYNTQYNESSPDIVKLGLDPCDTGWVVDRASVDSLDRNMKRVLKARDILASCAEVVNEF